MTALDASKLALATERYGRSIDVLDETDSTNDDARRAADDGAPDGHVVVADRQRAGRGAHGRPWLSPAGTDLYFSVVARLPLEPARLPPLTLAVGLGVARTVEALVDGSTVEIKWPNDVHLDGRKVAGVLVESASMGAKVEVAVLGIGLNVNRAEIEPELAERATSMRMSTDRALDREWVLAEVLGSVERQVDRFVEMGPRAVVAGVEARLAWRGQEVTCGDVAGRLVGLREDGALRIRTESGERAVVTGTLRPR